MLSPPRERGAAPRSSPRALPLEARPLPVLVSESASLTAGPLLSGAVSGLRELPPPAPLPFALRFTHGERTEHQDLRIVESTSRATATSLSPREPPLPAWPGSARGSPPRGVPRHSGYAPPCIASPHESHPPPPPAGVVGAPPPFRLPSRAIVTNDDVRAAVASDRVETAQVHRADLHWARGKALRATTAGTIRSEAVSLLDASPRPVGAEAAAWGARPREGEIETAWAGEIALAGEGAKSAGKMLKGGPAFASPRPGTAQPVTIAGAEVGPALGRDRGVLHWDAVATVNAPFASAAVAHSPTGQLGDSLLRSAASVTGRNSAHGNTFYSTKALASSDPNATLFSPREDVLPHESREALAGSIKFAQGLGHSPRSPRALARLRANSNNSSVSSSSASSASSNALGSSSTRVSTASTMTGLLPSASPFRPYSATPRAGEHVDLRDAHTLHALVSQERAAAAAASQRKLLHSRGLAVSHLVEALPARGTAHDPVSLSISRDRHVASARSRALADFTVSRPGNSQPGSPPRRYDEYGNEARSVRGLAPAWVHHSASVESEGSMLAPVHTIPLSVRDWGKFAGGASSPRRAGGAFTAAATLSAHLGGELSLSPGEPLGGVSSGSFVASEQGGGGFGSPGSSLTRLSGAGGRFRSSSATAVRHAHVQARVWSPRPALRPLLDGDGGGVAAAASQPEAMELCLDDAAFAGKLVAGTLQRPHAKPAVSHNDVAQPSSLHVRVPLPDGDDAISADAAREDRKSLASPGGGAAALLTTLSGSMRSGAGGTAGGEPVVPRTAALRAVNSALADTGHPFLAAQRTTAHEVSVAAERSAGLHAPRVSRGTVQPSRGLGEDDSSDDDEPGGGPPPVLVLNDSSGSVFLEGGPAAEMLSQRWNGLGIQRPSTLLMPPSASPSRSSSASTARRSSRLPPVSSSRASGSSTPSSSAPGTPFSARSTPLAPPPSALPRARSSLPVSTVELVQTSRREVGAITPRAANGTSGGVLLDVASGASAATVTPGSQHAPSPYIRSRAVSARGSVASERASGGRTLRTAHSAHAHWHTQRFPAADVDAGATIPVVRSAFPVPDRVAGVWGTYMDRSLTLQRQVGAADASSGMRPPQHYDSMGSRAAVGGSASTAAPTPPSIYPVGIDPSDAEGVRLGALRVGSEYVYPLKLRNHTPFTRRFRVVAAGWDDAPSTPRALMRLRYKALPIAPGLSATIVIVLRALEPGVLHGGVTLQSDDGELLRARVSAHAFAPAAFADLRADVAACGSLVPLATAAAALERAAEEWDAEHARGGALDLRDERAMQLPSRDSSAAVAALQRVASEGGPSFYASAPSGGSWPVSWGEERPPSALQSAADEEGDANARGWKGSRRVAEAGEAGGAPMEEGGQDSPIRMVGEEEGGKDQGPAGAEGELPHHPRSISPAAALLALSTAHGTTPSELLAKTLSLQRGAVAARSQQPPLLSGASLSQPPNSPIASPRSGSVASPPPLKASMTQTASVVARAFALPTGTLFDGQLAIITDRATIQDVPFPVDTVTAAHATLALQPSPERTRGHVPLGGGDDPLTDFALARIEGGGTHHLLSVTA